MRSIVSYKERGIGGNNQYRGNCSPKLILDLHEQYHFSELSDYMCGSGTSEAACNQIGITSHCYDLNRGFNLVEMDIPERNEFVFCHYPYWDMIKYSTTQYDAEEVQRMYGIDPRLHDLSLIPTWEEFVQAMNYCTMRQFASLDKGGRLAILMGDIKRKGKLYSMIKSICTCGELEQIIIKAQHNCWSDFKVYSSSNFIPIEHEYLMILRKDGYFYFPFTYEAKGNTDMANVNGSSWKDIVFETMKTIGGKCTLSDLYSVLGNSKRARANTYWKEKIRQTLQLYPQYFVHVDRGIWMCA